MNRSNTSANKDIGHIVKDMLRLLVAYGVAVLFMGRAWSLRTLGGMTGLAAIFVLLYVLGKEEQYLYNVTLFGYPDRIQRRRTGSFLVATAATVVLLPYITEDQRGYFLFLILAYSLESVPLLRHGRCCRDMERNRGEVPRTAFVGRRAQYNKFRYFLKKTSIPMELVGYIAASAQELVQISEGDAGEYLGSLEDLEMLIRRYHLDQIYILQKREEQLFSMQKYVDLCIDMGVTVRMVVDFYKRRRADSYVSCVGTYPVITYHTVTLNTGEQVIKRIMDVAGGLAGIVLFSPVMLLAALAIKLDSPGPVIFRQTRVGKNGRTFQIYKFRSMYVDAEARKAELMKDNKLGDGKMFKMDFDPRVIGNKVLPDGSHKTGIGDFIRRTSLDEFPQFFNVLKGDMSIVGTRPPLISETNLYELHHYARLAIKPGITGLWQVSGRSDITDFEEVVRLDKECKTYYQESWRKFAR